MKQMPYAPMEREEILKLVESAMRSDPELGAAWAYLKAGCRAYSGEQDGGKFSLHIEHPTFSSSEYGSGDETTTFSIPNSEASIVPDATPSAPKYSTPAGVKSDYSREDLIDICGRAIVPVSRWCNRDSDEAHKKVGECVARLMRGDDFEVITSGDCFATDARTIWLEIDGDSFYLPTLQRIEQSAGGDWY